VAAANEGRKNPRFGSIALKNEQEIGYMLSYKFKNNLRERQKEIDQEYGIKDEQKKDISFGVGE